jgi:replicative DNA helicase
MERTPPINIEAEQQVLGAMLQQDGGIEAIEAVRPVLKSTDFYHTYHQQIYKAILELHESGAVVDDLLAPPYQRIYKDFEKIADMQPPRYIELLKDSTPTAANAEYYAGKIKESSRLRGLIRLADVIKKRAYDADMEGIPSAALVGELLDGISRNEVIASVAGNVPTAKDDWPDVFNQLCRSQESEYLGLQTGFEALDNTTLGLRGLSVLGGIPGQGKTSIALQIACEVARINAVPVLFYALEMGKVDLYMKTISRLSKLDYRTLTIGSEMNGRRGRGLSESDSHKLSEASNGFMEYADRIRIVDRAVCRDLSLAIVRLHIQQAKREFDADRVLVVIDHLQIFPTEKPGLDDMKSKLDYLISEFKAISEQLNATILLISEKNRESYTKPSIGSYMGSAGIEYGVDLAMLLHEPGEETKDTKIETEDKDERDIELRIVKNRFGKKSRIKLTFYGAFSNFEE